MRFIGLIVLTIAGVSAFAEGSGFARIDNRQLVRLESGGGIHHGPMSTGNDGIGYQFNHPCYSDLSPKELSQLEGTLKMAESLQTPVNLILKISYQGSKVTKESLTYCVMSAEIVCDSLLQK